jgi:cytosine/adenosine deaminase-related metal-dependent hydrolase
MAAAYSYEEIAMTSAGVVLLSGGLVVTMDKQRRIITDGGVAVKNGRIIAVGKSSELADDFVDAVVIDTNGKMVIPGLIDAHNHPAHFLTKGLLDDIGAARRWGTRLYPFESTVSEEETYWGALGTFAEMIKTGTTCVADPGGLHPQSVARAAADIGIRATITGAMSDVHDPLRPWGVKHNATSATGVAERLYNEWNGAEGKRIRIWVGLWSPTTSSEELVRQVCKLAEKLDTGIHGHLASKPADNELTLERHGYRAVEWYHRLGILNHRFLAAHMGAITQCEVDLVAKSGTSVVHCASASMFGGFGCIAHGKFPELVSAGVTVALGTDAASISRFLDMARQMYLAACAHKDVRMDAEVMGAHKAMEMATIDGAQALMLDDEIGSIEVGKKADLVTVAMDGLEWEPRPTTNPIANFVYSSSGNRVDTVMVDGRILMKEGVLQTVDEKVLRISASNAAKSAAERANIPSINVWPVE